MRHLAKHLRVLILMKENDFNITSTSHDMYMSQAAVSKAIIKIEDRMGFQVFARNTPKRISGFTDEGLCLYEQAQELEKIYHEMNTLREENSDG